MEERRYTLGSQAASTLPLFIYRFFCLKYFYKYHIHKSLFILGIFTFYYFDSPHGQPISGVFCCQIQVPPSLHVQDPFSGPLHYIRLSLHLYF